MSVFNVVSNSRDRAAMNFSRLLIPVIKTSRSHRCHATMGIVIRFNGIPDPRFHKRIDSLSQEDGTIVRYSAESAKDLGGSTPSRWIGLIAIEARGPTRGSCSAIVVLLEFASQFADFRSTEKKNTC